MPKCNWSEVAVIFGRPHSGSAIAEEYILQLNGVLHNRIVRPGNDQLDLTGKAAQIRHPNFVGPIVGKIIRSYCFEEISAHIEEEEIKILGDARHRTNCIVNYQAVVTTHLTDGWPIIGGVVAKGWTRILYVPELCAKKTTVSSTPVS